MSRDAYTWKADVPPAHDHAWTRVYRRNGRVAHISEVIYMSHPGAPDSWDETDSWRGTGSQEEYDRAAKLPTCPRCFLVKVGYEHETGGIT